MIVTTDASWHINDGLSGVGYVLRDELSGKIVALGYEAMGVIGNSTSAELGGMCTGARVAAWMTEPGDLVQVICDSQSAVRAFRLNFQLCFSVRWKRHVVGLWGDYRDVELADKLSRAAVSVGRGEDHGLALRHPDGAYCPRCGGMSHAGYLCGACLGVA